MASIFWDSQSVIMVDYLVKGHMINGATMQKNLDNQEIVKKRRRSWLKVFDQLLQENAPANTTSQVAMAAATKCSLKVLPHIPNSQDLVPPDFYLFPNLKSNLRHRNFGNNEGTIDAVDEYLGDQEESFCFEGIRKLEQHLRKCIEARLDYIEK